MPVIQYPTALYGQVALTETLRGRFIAGLLDSAALAVPAEGKKQNQHCRQQPGEVAQKVDGCRPNLESEEQKGSDDIDDRGNASGQEDLAPRCQSCPTEPEVQPQSCKQPEAETGADKADDCREERPAAQAGKAEKMGVADQPAGRQKQDRAPAIKPGCQNANTMRKEQDA